MSLSWPSELEANRKVPEDMHPVAQMIQVYPTYRQDIFPEFSDLPAESVLIQCFLWSRSAAEFMQ